MYHGFQSSKKFLVCIVFAQAQSVLTPIIIIWRLILVWCECQICQFVSILSFTATVLANCEFFLKLTRLDMSVLTHCALQCTDEYKFSTPSPPPMLVTLNYFISLAHYCLVEVNGSDSLELVLLAVHDPSVANNTPYGFNTDFDYILQPVFKFNSCEFRVWVLGFVNT